jgi:hypothetical protein
MTITINLWHLIWGAVTYIAVGVLLYLPLNLWALTRISNPDTRAQLRRRIFRLRPFLVQVVAWPLAIAEDRSWL